MKNFKLNQIDSCNYLKEKHNIQISKSTLSKIWKNQY